MSKDADVMMRKLFIGGLPFHTTDKSLREHFEQYGGIEEAVVISDRSTGKSKGYGFVTMVDKEAADKACATKNPTIDGRKANVNLAYLGAKPRRAQAPNGGMAAGYMPLTTYGGQAGPGVQMDPVQQQLAYQQYLQQMQQFQQLQLQQQQLAMAAGGQAASTMATNGLQQMFHADYGQPQQQHVLTNGAGFAAQAAGGASYGHMMGATAPTAIPGQPAKFDQVQYGQSPGVTGFVQPGTSPITSIGNYSASPQVYGLPH